MDATPPTNSLRTRLGVIAVPLGAALCLWPAISTGTGLLLGLAVALALGNPFLRHTRRATHHLLALAIIGLGAGMDLRAVVKAGVEGAGITALSIGACLALGWLLTRALKVEPVVGALITIGTAICGGSAIAAVVPVLRPKEHETSVALATVFVLNAIALFLFPPIGHHFGLTDSQFGLWSALAIHDTSSVVGAASAFGAGALQRATIVKLTRALWIVPLTLGLGSVMRARDENATTHAKPKRPWFIAGFVGAAALVTFVPQLHHAGLLVAAASRQLLVLTLFLIGANLTPSALRNVGARPLAFAVLLWAIVASVSLLAIVRL